MIRIHDGSPPLRRTEPAKSPEPPKPTETRRDRWSADDRFERFPPRSPLATPTPPTPTPAPVATPGPATSSPPGPAYAGGLDEAELAALQQDQGPRNDCAEYAIAAGLNLLFGGSVRGSEVAVAADQVTATADNRLGLPLPVPGWGLRLWENGPTTPWQQANIVNGVARQGGLPLVAEVTHATPEALVGLLGQGDTAVIVTLGWNGQDVPQIAQGSGPYQSLGDPGTWNLPLGLEVPAVGAHAMLLAAHDPDHVDQNGNPAPWGFVNSWAEGASATNPGGATEIYWMSDEDFREAYNFPLIGNAVVITRQSTPAATPEAEPAPTPGPTATPTAPPEDR